LHEHGYRLRVPVKNEYRRVKYPTQRIENIQVRRLGEAERSEGCLHPRGGITQQIQILDCASRVADLQLDTVASKYLSILLRSDLVPGSLHPGRDYEVTRRQRIDQAIRDVQGGKDYQGRQGQKD